MDDALRLQEPADLARRSASSRVVMSRRIDEA